MPINSATQRRSLNLGLSFPSSGASSATQVGSAGTSAIGTGGAGVGVGDGDTGGDTTTEIIDAAARAVAATALALATSALQPGDVTVPINDGTQVDLQDRDGTVGDTEGNLMFAAKSEDGAVARPLTLTDQGLRIDQTPTTQLLLEVVKQLQALNKKLN